MSISSNAGWRTVLASVLFGLSFLGCGISHQNYLRVGGEGRPEWKQSEFSLERKAEEFEKLLPEFISPYGTLIYQQPSGEKFTFAGLADVCDWTGACLGAEALRYSVTKDPQALERVKSLLGGLELLHRVTGVSGLFARNAIPPGISVPESGVWYDGKDEYQGWRWKGDVSKDQYSGALFGLSLAWELSNDEGVKKRVAALATAVADHLIKNKFLLIDANGEETSYGNINATMYLFFPIGVNALISLTALKLAEKSTEQPRFEQAYQEKIQSGWHNKTYWAKFQIFGKTNHNNDNMSFLCYYPLLWMERDEKVREAYLDSLKRSWSYVYREGNSFFAYVCGAFDCADPQGLEEAKLTLELFPLDRRVFAFDHSEEKRFDHAFFSNRKGRLKAKYPIPINWRSPSSFAWKTDPYELVSGGDGEGAVRCAPHDYLLAYWLGRAHHFLEPQTP